MVNVYDVNGSFVGKAEVKVVRNGVGVLPSGKGVYRLHGKWTVNAPKGRTIGPVKYQTGRSDFRVDRHISALKPGKRRSATGNMYWETRKNRSDLRKKI